MSCVNQQMLRYEFGNYKFAGSMKYHMVYENKLNQYIPISCGQCDLCKLKRSQIWAARCTIESSNWLYSYFITLTYDDEHLPIIESYNERTGALEKRSNLQVSHIQKFIRSLRKRKFQLKYLCSGEYGSKSERAHYHMILFTNSQIPLEYYKLNENKQILYQSKFLSDIWKRGYVVVGEFTPETAAYVARYTLKKVSKKRFSFLKSNYKQEFISMSKGIGTNNVIRDLDNVMKTKNLTYSFNKIPKQLNLWRTVIDKLDKLGYEVQANQLRNYYRKQAELVNKVNNIGYENWIKKVGDIKYCYEQKIKQLNTKL